MRDDDGDDLTPAERDALAAMGSDWAAPAGLRARVAGEARARGLLARPAHSSRRALWGAATAAAILVFSAGVWVGTLTGGTPGTTMPDPTAEDGAGPRQNHYLLLLYEDEAYDAPATPAAHAERAREYGDWMRSLQRAGRLAGGDELAGEARLLRRTPERMAEEPASPDPVRGVLGGYFRIAAASDAEAAAVASECPHLRHGGTVEIRRVVE